MEDTRQPKTNAQAGRFCTTHWSVVLKAGDPQAPDALACLTHLCQTYWYPLYGCVRRHGYSPADAQDLTQAFFAKLLDKDRIALADPSRGRFRTFLLRSLENFLRTQHRDRNARKRGGGQQFVSLDAGTAEERYAEDPAGTATPAEVFERDWAATLIEQVLDQLRREFATSGRLELFDALEPHLWGDELSTPHAQIAAPLGMTVVAVRVTLHRLRQRLHDLLRQTVAATLENPAEIDDELRHLRQVLAR
ncbi:MAG: sigma-70 family RNA polymerase sigma factor [Verrucomicrobiae bacterium]|nr:sigma-70 family RNA polymerase sigma factor [Verrucomicrobiae bacterium]